ncbi:MAG: hypothetical protein ABL909_06220 [Sphingopyxis sp.]
MASISSILWPKYARGRNIYDLARSGWQITVMNKAFHTVFGAIVPFALAMASHFAA